MNITEIRNEAIQMNKTYFNNSLDISLVSFRISKRMTRSLGTFTVKRGKQEITLAYQLLENEWRNTLIHELVHCWQYQIYEWCNHGYSFKMKAREIYNKDGIYKITVCTDSVGMSNFHKEKVKKPIFHIHKDGRSHFLRSLSSSEYDHLEKSGFTIDKVSGLNVTCHRNFSSMLSAKYHYNTKDINKSLERNNGN